MKGNRVVHGMAMAAAVGGALALQSAPAAAQAKLELTPVFTSFYALSKVSEFTGAYEKHVPAAGFGGRLTYWVSPTIGIEASGSYNSSGTQFVVTDTALSGASFSGNMTTFSGRVLYRPARTNLYLFAGAGTVMRGGDTWDLFGFTETNDFGGLGGFGVRASVTPKLSLLVSAEVMVYALDADGPDGTFYESKTQADLSISIGVPIALMK